MEEMLGSYAPGQTNEKKFPLEEAPSGMLARGKYEARSKFTDDDGHSYLDFAWSFEVLFLFSATDSKNRSRKIGISG
jgi:Rho GDP-dissociation inhibitor